MIKKLFLLTIFFITTLLGDEQNYIQYKTALKNKNYLKAKVYLQRTLQESIQDNNTQKVATIYNKIGDLYNKTGEYYKAIEYYKLSLKLNYSQEKVNQLLLLKNYSNLSKSYTKIGNIFKAFKYSHKAVAVADQRYGKSSKQAKEITNNSQKLQSRLIEASI